jgi:molecular chaperone GrpE
MSQPPVGDNPGPAQGPGGAGAAPGASGGAPEDPERVVIRDKRRIDRTDSEVEPDPSGPPAADGADNIIDPNQFGPGPVGADGGDPDQISVDPILAELQSQIGERTADLQRLQAEYANYRKRMDRDRALLAEAATGTVLAAFLPVLDDLDRAAQHGDLTGPLKSVSDQIDGVLTKFGLQPFGEVGDPFDPTIHEAVLHDSSDAVDAPTCTTVMRKGYRMGERLLRPAMVGVSDPA